MLQAGRTRRLHSAACPNLADAIENDFGSGIRFVIQGLIFRAFVFAAAAAKPGRRKVLALGA